MTTWRQIDERHWESGSHEAMISLAMDDESYAETLLVWRKDSKPLGAEHFAVLQAAKNAIFGPERTAVEVYPPESELRDRANVYWLQVLPEGHRIPWLRHQRRSVVEGLVK